MNTINVNGTELATARVLLVFAKGALRIMSAGLKIRNTNLKSIKASLAAQGVVLKGKTAADCYNEVLEIFAQEYVLTEEQESAEYQKFGHLSTSTYFR